MAVKRLNNAEREAIRDKLLAPIREEVNEAYLKVKGLESINPCTNIESLRAELGRFKK
ncbi:hypothetical protein [Barnesiella intestinihominis]|uniref:hypothetical protein n=1 Tax=Barnesiella intestinihominis TaxID=487174 RepID=UPI003AB9023E